MCECSATPYRRGVPTGRIRHSPFDRLVRHRHDQAFAAVVLAGHYTEAGDTGRHRVSPGHVLIHGPFEAHTDSVEHLGADVLILPLPGGAWPAHALVDDPDALARLAETDLALAAAALTPVMTPYGTHEADWPDALATALRADPDLNLGQWARTTGMHVGSLSRGFRSVFSITPQEFRLIQRAHRAIRSILAGTRPLSGIAGDNGFADQAHMTRAIRRVTGQPPGRLRGRDPGAGSPAGPHRPAARP